jgi:pimeloyl-ACP methyl ester carboxylesterase
MGTVHPHPIQDRPPMSSPSASTSAAALAFGQSRIARWLAASLRATERFAPELAARLALDLFFSPMPSKFSARKTAGPGWHVERLPVHGVGHVALLRHARSQAAQPPRQRVLLVHGWAGSALQMLPLAQALAASGWDPVLLELPAHGRSDGWRCTMPQIVASLFAAQRQLGQVHAVVAHSMGAVGSLHAAARGLAARRLVVMAPSSPPASVLRWFGDVFGLSDAMVDRMRRRIVKVEGMVLEQFEPAWFATRVDAPVLVLHDRDDRMAPLANGQALVRALPHAELRVIDGSSHRRMLSDARVIQSTLVHLAAA